MYIEIIFTLLVGAAYLVSTSSIGRVLRSIGARKKAAPQRATYIAKVFNAGVFILAAILMSLIWGVDYGSVLVLASSVLAVLGVAFFAQWSILSNITASIVIFFSYPSRIGDRVRIVDGENSLTGEIQNINLFQVLIRDDDGNLINYPNNLIIQKPLVRITEPEAAPPEAAPEVPVLNEAVQSPP